MRAVFRNHRSRRVTTSVVRAHVRRGAALAVLGALIVGCNDTVVTAPDTSVASVAVSPSARTVYVGATVALTAIAKTSSGSPVTDRAVTWTSGAPDVAIVTASGVVQARKAGTVRITARIDDKEAFADITVSDVPVASVVLAPDSLDLVPGSRRQLQALARDAAGRPLEGRAVAFSSSHPMVASVSPSGEIEAVSPGFAFVHADVEGKRATTRVIVGEVPVARVVVSTTAVEVEQGESVMIIARAEDAQGNHLPGRLIYWGSSDPMRVEVLSNGQVTGVREGHATLTISSEEKSAQVAVRVVPAPSADLLYERSDFTGVGEIFRLSLTSGATPERLNAGSVSFDPSPSPDGTRFVFAVHQVDPFGNRQNDLYIVNVDGTNMRWLTRTPGVEYQPAWSPDGTRIAFAATDHAGGDIWVINVDGTGLRNLTASLGAQSMESNPAWSPDGRQLAFETSTFGIIGPVWAIGADGTNARALTTGGSAWHPTWAPDGQRLAVVKVASGGADTDLVIVPVGGGSETRLAMPGAQREPAWSPDGRHLAYTQVEASGRMEIYTMQADGSTVRLRTRQGSWGGGRNPAWITRR